MAHPHFPTRQDRPRRVGHPLVAEPSEPDLTKLQTWGTASGLIVFPAADEEVSVEQLEILEGDLHEASADRRTTMLCEPGPANHRSMLL